MELIERTQKSPIMRELTGQFPKMQKIVLTNQGAPASAFGSSAFMLLISVL